MLFHRFFWSKVLIIYRVGPELVSQQRPFSEPNMSKKFPNYLENAHLFSFSGNFRASFLPRGGGEQATTQKKGPQEHTSYSIATRQQQPHLSQVAVKNCWVADKGDFKLLVI
jgi:hypothetical protein